SRRARPGVPRSRVTLQPDVSGEAAGAAVAAVGEQTPVLDGAAGVDLDPGDAGAGELLDDPGADVEAGSALGRGGVGAGDDGGDLVPHRRGDLVAAAARGGADRGA